MAADIERVVDAHVHLWDPAWTHWYPYLSGLVDLGMGDISGWARVFDQETYFAESAKWNVVKFVHVSAATDFVAETLEKEAEAQATGHPDAIIGGVAPGDAIAETVAQLDKQMTATHFRGVRPMGGYEAMEGAIPRADVLGALLERGLIFEAMAHTHELEGARASLADWGELTVVLEHTGWPASNTDEEFEQWKAGMTGLAALGPNIHCKLSGLSMPLGTTEASVFQRWIDHCIDVFGVDRCFFASNLPPDGAHGSFDDIYTTYDKVTAGLSAADRDKLFATNAERLYRI